VADWSEAETGDGLCSRGRGILLELEAFIAGINVSADFSDKWVWTLETRFRGWVHRKVCIYTLQKYCEHNSVSAELLRAFKLFVERFGSIEIHGF